MAKVQIKTEKLRPFEGIFSIMEPIFCSSGYNHRFQLGIEVLFVVVSTE